MAAELDRLHGETLQLAKKLERAGHPDFAELLGGYARCLEAKAAIAARLGLKSVFPRPEIPAETVTFTDNERGVLTKDGAVIYLLTGETIKSQKSARRPFWYVADGFTVNGKNRLTEFPSRRVEVAIYLDPDRFFVPESSSKTTDQQIALVEADAHSLRGRLGLPNIGEILPEASEATEVLFKHFDATKVRILGQDYIRDRYWSYIRTSTPTNKEGSFVATVGKWGDDDALVVLDWPRSAFGVAFRAARWVVPQGTR